MLNNRWYNLALRLAQASQHDTRMAAVVVRGGAVLSAATNSRRLGRHAELRALLGFRNYSGATLYIARDGGKMSKPCSKCMERIQKVGLARIVFADWSGHLSSIQL